MISVQNRLQQLSGNKILVLFFVMVIGACSPKLTPPPKGPEPPVDKPRHEPILKVEKPVEKVEPVEMQISLVLPFEIDQANYQRAKLSDIKKSELAIDFYQGFKMGIDSAAKQGKNVNFKIHVFDSKDDVNQLSNLSKNSAIKSADLIIGPIFPNGIRTFSNYSKQLKKPMVSPLAASDPEVFNNPFLISVNNALDQHAFKASVYIKNQLKAKKVLIIRSGQADEYKYINPFKKGMDSLAKGLPVTEIGIKAIGYANIYKYLSPIGLNTIVLGATDRLFLSEIFKKLNELSLTYQIAVVGHPEWERLSFLDYTLLEKLNTYTTSSYQIDYKSARSKQFINSYRNTYTLEPSEYSFKGFDTGYYFGMLMNKKGKSFMDFLATEGYDGIHNDFRFKKDIRTGYYNQNLMVMKFQAGRLLRIQ